MASLSLSSDVRVVPCATCAQTINTGMEACPYCGAKVDHRAAEAAAESFAQLNQAISDASYLKIMAGCLVTFCLLRWVPFLSLIGVGGFWFLEFAIPFMLIRWWVRYGSIKSEDPEFRGARRNAIYVCGGTVLFLVLVNIGALLI